MAERAKIAERMERTERLAQLRARRAASSSSQPASSSSLTSPPASIPSTTLDFHIDTKGSWDLPLDSFFSTDAVQSYSLDCNLPKWKKFIDPVTLTLFFRNDFTGSVSKSHPLHLVNGKETLEEEWEQFFDHNSNNHFFYNKRTGETSWHSPTEWSEDEMIKQSALVSFGDTEEGDSQDLGQELTTLIELRDGEGWTTERNFLCQLHQLAERGDDRALNHLQEWTKRMRDRKDWRQWANAVVAQWDLAHQLSQFPKGDGADRTALIAFITSSQSLHELTEAQEWAVSQRQWRVAQSTAERLCRTAKARQDFPAVAAALRDVARFRRQTHFSREPNETDSTKTEEGDREEGLWLAALMEEVERDRFTVWPLFKPLRQWTQDRRTSAMNSVTDTTDPPSISSISSIPIPVLLPNDSLPAFPPPHSVRVWPLLPAEGEPWTSQSLSSPSLPFSSLSSLSVPGRLFVTFRPLSQDDNLTPPECEYSFRPAYRLQGSEFPIPSEITESSSLPPLPPDWERWELRIPRLLAGGAPCAPVTTLRRCRIPSAVAAQEWLARRRRLFPPPLSTPSQTSSQALSQEYPPLHSPCVQCENRALSWDPAILIDKAEMVRLLLLDELDSLATPLLGLRPSLQLWTTHLSRQDKLHERIKQDVARQWVRETKRCKEKGLPLPPKPNADTLEIVSDPLLVQLKEELDLFLKTLEDALVVHLYLVEKECATREEHETLEISLSEIVQLWSNLVKL